MAYDIVIRGGEIVDLVGETGPVAKVVLLLLLLPVRADDSSPQ